MSSRPRRTGASKSKDPATEQKQVLELIQGITGASTEDIEFTLKECGGDADEATARLIDDPSLHTFSQVQSKKEKKKKRDEERKTAPVAPTSMEGQQRGGGRGRGRGRDRGSRGHDRSERSIDRGSRQVEQPSSVEVSFDASQGPTWGQGQRESTGGWEDAADKEGTGWDNVSSLGPNGESTGGGWDSAAPNGSASGSWGAIAAHSEQPSKPLGAQDAGTVAPPTHSTQQPIGKQSAPAPIRPPNQGSKPSMADLFKQKPPAPVQQSPAPAARPASASQTSHHEPPAPATLAPVAHAPSTPQSAAPGTHGNDVEDSHDWGPNTSDQKIEMQGDTGFPGNQKSAQSGPGVIQSSAGLNSLPPVSRVHPGQNWQPTEERNSSDAWGAGHGSPGLRGIGLDSGLHHNYLGDNQGIKQSSWLSKTSQPQSLGNAILSSLSQPPVSQSSEHLPIVSPHASELTATSSGYNSTNLGQSVGQRLPNHQNSQLQANQMQFGDFTGQLGNLQLGDSKQDIPKAPAPAQFSTFGQNSLPNLQTSTASNGSHPLKPAAGTLFQPGNISGGSTPQGFSGHNLGQQALSQNARQPGQTNSQQVQHQRAMDAFNSATTQPQGSASQKSTGAASATPAETSTASSQNLYSQQGGYQSGQGYSQYQYPGSQQTYSGYNSYQQDPEQAPAPTTPQAPAAQKQQKAANSTNSSISYDPSNFAAYNQQASQRELSQAAPEFQPPAHKYANTSQNNISAGSGTGSHATPSHSSTVLSQPALSQMSQTYGNQLAGMPQNFYTNQQYTFPQYSNYSQGSGGNYGYGHGSAYQQQQAAYNHPGASGFNQAGKYGGGAYAAAGGYQHAGYGAKDKDHQGAHVHGLYGQQQVPLGRQHYAGTGVQDHSAYGYQAPNQAYGGYGRQYGQQYYGQNQ